MPTEPIDTAHCESDHEEPHWAVATWHLVDSTSAANITALCGSCLTESIAYWLDEQSRGLAEPIEILPLAVAPKLPTEGGAVEGTTGQGCSGGETAAEIRAGADSREVGAVVSEALPASEEGDRGEPSAPVPPGATDSPALEVVEGDASHGIPAAWVDALCEVMHVAYEDEARRSGWATQAASRVAWPDVPAENKAAMRAGVDAMLRALFRGDAPWPGTEAPS